MGIPRHLRRAGGRPRADRRSGVHQELFDELGGWLGVGLANLAAAFDPGRFVIGGGVSEAGELLLAPAREAFRRTLTGRGFRPEAPIVRAGLGVDAGVVGAADLARDVTG